MSTYKELTHFVLDMLKMNSDDSHFQPEHILFLLDKHRVFILKQRYADIKKPVPQSNFQTICLDLEYVESFDGDCCSSKGYLRSVQEIPNMVVISTPKISTMDFFQGKLSFTNKERFKYVGNNKYLSNIIYSTIAPDNHLYLTSANPQFRHLEKVKLTGVFEDSLQAAELECNKKETCDVLDNEFPLEVGLISTLIDLIVKELGIVRDIPEDDRNNAKDDYSDLATWIERNLKDRAKKKAQNQTDDD